MGTDMDGSESFGISDEEKKGGKGQERALN